MRNTRRQKSGKIIKESNYYFFGWTSSGCWGQLCLFSKSLLPTTKVNGVSVGWLNVNAAEEKLAQVNQTEEVVVQTGTKEEKFNFLKIPIGSKFLKDHLHSSKVKLPLNEAFKKN